MPKSRPPYAPEFRRQMIELVQAGRPPEELAREFEASAQTIRNWVAQAARDAGMRRDGRLPRRGARRAAPAAPGEPSAARGTGHLGKSCGLVRAGDRAREVFRFMSANQVQFAVAAMVRVLGVSTSGYSAWRRRTPSARACSEARLEERIGTIHTRSRSTYGAPRIRAALVATATHVAQKRVERLMRTLDVSGVSRRRGVRTTRRQAGARPAPDLVKRCFAAEASDRLWVADITYVPTTVGRFLYLTVVIDAFSRRVVGWSMGHHLQTLLVLGALNMAGQQRRHQGVIHHSDQGSQYTSLAFGARCQQLGVRLSMGSVGDCFDNAMAESFFATLECELLERTRLRTLDEARLAIFDFIEGWYNPHRLHSALGYQSPINIERSHYAKARNPSEKLSTKMG